MQIIKQFKALSDLTRLRLLNILNRHELNVNEIVSIVGMIQSGVSRHLKILLESGLLVSRRDGSYIYYAASRSEEARPLIDLACNHAQGNPTFHQDLQGAEQSIVIRKNRSQRFFKTVAPQWDRLKKEVLGDFKLNDVLHRLVDGRQEIADLGCGTGELLSCLVKAHKKKLIGVDSSPEMLEQAKIRLASDRAIELRLGELEHLPMKDNEVDCVVMSMVLYHIVEPERSIREAYRVLKPGGVFILADFERHNKEAVKKIIGGAWMGFEMTQIQHWLKTAGFDLGSFDRHRVEKKLSINLYVSLKTKPAAKAEKP